MRRPERVLALAAGLLGVGLLAGFALKARCAVDGGWSGGEQFTELCYTDVVALWHTRGLSTGAVPYLEAPLEYPVVTGAWVWLSALLARALPITPPSFGFLVVTAVGSAALTVATLFVLRGTLRSLGRDPGRLVWWAAAPPLALGTFVNWDALPVLLLVGAVAAHVRGRDGTAGVLAGLGAAAKMFPGFLVPLVVLARLRSGRPRDAARHAGGAAAAWLVVDLPVLLAAPEGWLRFYRLNSERGGHVDSLWYLAQQALGLGPLTRDQLSTASAVLFVLGALAVVAVGTRTRPPERWWELLLPVLVVFVLVNKVYSPQYTLWLLPLLVLVLPRPAPYVLFVAADTVVHVLEYSFLGGRAGYEPAVGYAVFGSAVALRAGALLWAAGEALARRPPGQRQEPNQTRSRSPSRDSSSAV